MYDQAGILSMGKKNRVFEIHNRSAAVFRGQHNPVFGHLPGDLAGNRIRKLALLPRKAPNHKDADDDQRKQQQEGGQSHWNRELPDGGFGRFCFHNDPFFLFFSLTGSCHATFKRYPEYRSVSCHYSAWKFRGR